MTPEAVDHCSWWPEGSWAACCAVHDTVSQGWADFASHVALGSCVADTSGGAVMGITMTVGIMLFGWVYDISRRIKRRRR